MTTIYKIAQNDTPHPDTLALYVESLKLYLKDNPNADKNTKELISDLPIPKKIKTMSKAECDVLYETIGYLWRQIAGKDISEESKIITSPETLHGCYWMFNNGVLLHGINHYTIIKQNSALVCHLLHINGMTLQEYLASNPNKLINYILKNGGVRIFVNKERKLYCQMSSKIYGQWGKHKIRKLDFHKKIIKIIDFKTDYKGWESGISVVI